MSKRWLSEALPAYFSQNIFHFKNADQLVRCFDLYGLHFRKNVRAVRIELDYLPASDVIEQIFHGFDEEVAGHIAAPIDLTGIASPLNQCTQLRTLSIGFRKYDYRWNWIIGSYNSDPAAMRHEPKYGEWMAFIEGQFAALLGDLKHIRGLRACTLKFGVLDDFLHETTDKEELEEHLRALEKEVMAEATKPTKQKMA